MKETIPPLIRPYQKEGIALHAENTVQALLDHPRDIPDIIEHSNEIINGHFNSSLTGEYKKAGWRVKIGMAAVGHLVARASLLDIMESYSAYGVPFRPDGRFEAYAYTRQDAIKDASRNSYWLEAHTFRLFRKISLSDNPYYPLCRYYNLADELHHSRQVDWSAGPGKNRWPVLNPHREFSAKERLARSLRLNCGMAINHLCTKAIHHLIHKNREADNEELYAAAMGSIERISWETTGNRHYGWVPDWKERQANNERLPDMAPEDGMKTLLFVPPSKLTQPNDYASSVDGAAIMKNADFCLHKALQDGPVAQAGLCPGNVFIRPRDSDTRDISRDFFESLDMDPNNGDCYSLAGIALAMAGATLRDTILPIYEANKESEATRNLQD